MDQKITEATPSFYIREIPIYGDALLAPMDGYSDWPFRSLCRKLGSAMSYTEFVTVETVLSAARRNLRSDCISRKPNAR